MKQYIDKDDAAAAIKKCYNECHKGAKNTGADYWKCNVLAVLNDATKVKEVNLNNEYIEEIYSHLDSIKDTADRMTSGNFMHNKAAIKFSADTIAKVLELMGLKANNPVTTVEPTESHLQEPTVVYVVSRSEEHSDYVEEVFLDESKAEKYCDQFKGDENEYARYITKVKLTL